MISFSIESLDSKMLEENKFDGNIISSGGAGQNRLLNFPTSLSYKINIHTQQEEYNHLGVNHNLLHTIKFT